jgi:hypothetical protein
MVVTALFYDHTISAEITIYDPVPVVSRRISKEVAELQAAGLAEMLIE